MALARRTKRIVAAVVGALVALTLVGLGFVGNFLVDFALNPHAEVSMARSMGSGRVSGLEGSREAKADDAYAETAAAWFDATRESVSHQAEDGTVLLGWRLDGADDAAYSDGHAWAVVCHGYVGEPADMAKYAYHFAQMGMSVLMPAARGHERNVDTGLIQMGWQDARDLLVLVGHAGGAVDDEDDDVGLLAGHERLLADARGEDVLGLSGLDAAGVDEGEVAAVPVGVVIRAVARDPARLVDDGVAAHRNAVDERGLSDVRAADHGDYGLRHLISLLFHWRRKDTTSGWFWAVSAQNPHARQTSPA